ncbi:hypothetical protein Tco_0627583 [Tanacetum coccineum]|uniref:Uncharacterized protein n=1 Tax=Tanacetum coccineum TaxID=301880 RepID=A0ABQ4WMV5_9ASTR
MVSTMTTRNASRQTAATRGGGTSKQDGRECKRTGNQTRSGRNGQGSQKGGHGGQESDQGSQGSSIGNRVNEGGGRVLDFATIIAQHNKAKVNSECYTKAMMLTDEAVRNGALKKNTKKRGNSGEPSRDVRDDKKRLGLEGHLPHQ